MSEKTKNIRNTNKLLILRQLSPEEIRNYKFVRRENYFHLFVSSQQALLYM